MKSLKKSPKHQLEKFSLIFMQIGLVFVLFLVLVSFEYKSSLNDPMNEIAFVNPIVEYTIDKPIVYVKEIPKSYSKPIKSDVVKQITSVKVVDNKTITDNVIVITPTDDDKIDLNLSKVKEVVIDDISETDDPKPVSINGVHEIPVFKGCEGLSRVASRKCFDKKMERLVQRYFDASIAEDLGMKAGKKRIYAQFLINKKGNVTGVKIKAPHPRLKKETKKVLSKVPKFKPGKQNGKFVDVKYILPITFKVQ